MRRGNRAQAEREQACGVENRAQRPMPQLRIEQGVETGKVERRNHGIAEIREEIAQVEQELATGLKLVVGQGIEIVQLSPLNVDDSVCQTLAGYLGCKRSFWVSACLGPSAGYGHTSGQIPSFSLIGDNPYLL